MRVILSLAMILAGAVPALAQTACTEPAAPPPIDGAQANADQLRAAMAQARDFNAQAQLYQNCIQQSATPDGQARIAGIQKMQERVSQTVNSAVEIYKKTHTY